MPAYDAFLLLSFGGPEGPDDVLPFLENVTRGRGVPAGAAGRGGRALPRLRRREPDQRPVQATCSRRSGAAFAAGGIDLPLYWGNRNWHPFIEDTVRQMSADGVTRALAFVTSAYSSYSACRQYLDDIDRAVAAVGPGAPRIDKIRPYFNHPGFIEPFAASVEEALAGLAAGVQAGARLVFTAHSVPVGMAAASGSRVHGHGGPRCRRRQVRGRAAGSRTAYLRTSAWWLSPLRPGLPEPQRPAERALAGTGRERPPGGAGQGHARQRGTAARRPAVGGRRRAGRLRQRPHGGRARPGRGGRRRPRRRSASRSRGPRRPARPRGSPRWCASWSRSASPAPSPWPLAASAPRAYPAGGAESCPADCCRYNPARPPADREVIMSGTVERERRDPA